MFATGPRTTSTPASSSGSMIDEAVGLVAGALEILPRAVDHHRDAAEVLHAADVDRHAGIVGALLEVHARHAEEGSSRPRRHELIELLAAHRAHAGQRLDHDFLGPACHHRDRIEHRCDCASAGDAGET